MRDDFGVLILSHGRPDLVTLTVTALTKARYSGRWWIVLDDEDETRPAYEERWGADRIVTFSKDEVAGTFDLGDNADGPRSVVVYARNAVDGIARDLGLTYYLEADDDYTYFAHRLNREGTLTYAYTYRLDEVLEAFIEFLEATGATTVAFAQGGDFIGGVNGAWRTPVKRKAMNTFIAKVGRPIQFVGRINEDTTAYVWRGSVGELFLTVTDVAINQINTQEQAGGLTDAYLDLGTYVKSFYSVMWSPSCVKVATLGDLHHRVHHFVEWRHAVPRILSDRYRRTA